MQGYPNANLANGRESTQITAFVIPNVVRNLASNALGVRPWASGGEPTEQASGAKENQAVRSEASYLIFRLASVAKACEAHEALTFWLLLGQAKSNGKEIHRFALNDKCPNANFANGRKSKQIPPLCHSERLLCHSEHSEESRLGKGKRFFAYALNDKRPNAEEHPPPSKVGKSEAKGDVIPSKVGEER